MHIDTRGVIFGTWLVFAFGTISSALTFNFLANTTDHSVPANLNEAFPLVLGLWTGGLLAGLAMALIGWHRGARSAVGASVLGYAFGASLRLVFLGVFLTGSSDHYTLAFDIISLAGIPPYLAFLLLVISGAMFAGLGAWVGLWLAKQSGRPNGFFPMAQLEPRGFFGIAALMLLTLTSLVLLSSINEGNQDPIRLYDTYWLVSPFVNMLLAAFLGSAFGLFYFAEHRTAAFSTAFLALAAHLMILLIVEEVAAGYDPFNPGLEPNRVDLLPFIALWFFVPMCGAAGAFAFHNLRDVFGAIDGEMATERP